MQSQSTILSMNKKEAEKSLVELQAEQRNSMSPEQLQILDMDFILDADQLDDKYNPNGDGEHPVFARDSWRVAVANQDTISGYWDWVEHQIAQHHSIV